MYKYSIEISYSGEDKGYIAVVPELPGCSAFGATKEDRILYSRTVNMGYPLYVSS